LYEHLTLHCSFIAHYNRQGFFDTYFIYPASSRRFFSQFDNMEGCLSVEYSGLDWLYHPEAEDLNRAMVIVAASLLASFRGELDRRQSLDTAETTRNSAMAHVRLLKDRLEKSAHLCPQCNGYGVLITEDGKECALTPPD
jgi:hypothetical protein